jgi:ribosome maturation factor RimP
MVSKDVVRNIVLSTINDTAIFLVDVKVDSSNRIFVEVDKPDGITIDECVMVSRAVEAGLDREAEDFDLEVSSPGLTEPFKVMEQYRKNCGRQINVLKRDGQKISGLLLNTGDEGITLEVQSKVLEAGKKRPKTVGQTIEIQFNDIKTTKVTITL